jgi:hypothetical protein
MYHRLQAVFDCSSSAYGQQGLICSAAGLRNRLGLLVTLLASCVAGCTQRTMLEH